MERELFAARLNQATASVLEFTRMQVADELPDRVLYLVTPNASFDGNPLEFDEEVFPEDSLPDGRRHRSSTHAEGVLDFLWRRGKVPEWINISVWSTDGESTFVELLCCGRFSAGEALYHTGDGIPPFHVLSPPLPRTWFWETERKSIKEMVEKYGRYPLPDQRIVE